MAIRVGVVLSGCGVFDGTEIHEAVSVLIALDKRGAQVTCMAPNIAQADVVNHAARKPGTGGRNVLEESARIARGNIRDVASVKADQLDALIFPGGFGAAKNLSTFAKDAAAMRVNPEITRLVDEMVKAKKPIGLACIAPVLAAAILGAQGLNPKVTIGTDKGTADAIRAMKAMHIDTAPADICVDEANRIVTTPCYMTASGPWEVFQGAEKMVTEVLRMAGTR